MEYMVSAVIKNKREEKKIEAVSEKQAWYFFGKTYGFKMRDFKAIEMPRRKTTEQLSFLKDPA